MKDTLIETMIKARKTLLVMARSMQAHPDCEPNSEFEGFALNGFECAEEIENVLKYILSQIENN